MKGKEQILNFVAIKMDAVHRKKGNNLVSEAEILHNGVDSGVLSYSMKAENK